MFTGIRQTAESSCEFLKIKNVQLKTVQNNSYIFLFLGKRLLIVKQKLRENLVTCYKFKFAVCLKRDSKSLCY